MTALGDAKRAARAAALAAREATHRDGAGSARLAAGHALEEIARLRDVGCVSAYLPVRNEIDPRPVTIDGWRAERTIAIEHLELVATLDGDDVGVAECGWGSVSGESKTAFLGAWVLPAARRRGVGTALVDRCVAFARKHGMTSGRSGALEGDDAAIRFAARYGLEVKGAAQIGRAA